MNIAQMNEIGKQNLSSSSVRTLADTERRARFARGLLRRTALALKKTACCFTEYRNEWHRMKSFDRSKGAPAFLLKVEMMLEGLRQALLIQAIRARS
jgi:hypothetical protein